MISVLFVDDNTDFLAQFRPVLEKTGEVRLEVVASTKQAIEKLKNRAFDVIVCYEEISILSNNFNLPGKRVTDAIDQLVEAIVEDAPAGR